MNTPNNQDGPQQNDEALGWSAWLGWWLNWRLRLDYKCLIFRLQLCKRRCHFRILLSEFRILRSEFRTFLPHLSKFFHEVYVFLLGFIHNVDEMVIKPNEPSSPTPDKRVESKEEPQRRSVQRDG